MAIYQLYLSMPGTAQGQAGTSRDKAGTSRDKAGTVHACPCWSLSVPVCPSLSLSVPVCPCMSLHLLYLHFYPCRYEQYEQYEHSYSDFPCKSQCSNACKSCFKFLPYFYFPSSMTLSFNPNSYIPVINIAKGSTWFLWNIVFSVYIKVTHYFHSLFFSCTLMDFDLSYYLIIFWRRDFMVKGWLCGLWISDHPHWLEWYQRNHCLWFFIWAWQRYFRNWSVLKFLKCYNLRLGTKKSKGFFSS